MFILHWPVMLLIRWVFYQQLGLAPVPTIVLMFVGGLTLSMIIVWKVKRFKTPFIKEVSLVLAGANSGAHIEEVIRHGERWHQNHCQEQQSLS